jgi:hypothetical protein
LAEDLALKAIGDECNQGEDDDDGDHSSNSNAEIILNRNRISPVRNTREVYFSNCDMVVN